MKIQSRKEKRARNHLSSQQMNKQKAGQATTGLKFNGSMLSEHSGETKHKESSFGGTSLLYGLESRIRGQEQTEGAQNGNIYTNISGHYTHNIPL